MAKVFTQDMAKRMVAHQIKTSYNSGYQVFMIPEGFTTIGKSAFENMDIDNVIFPKSLEVIEDNAFKNCSLREVRFPEQVRYIGNSAFEDCVSLHNVEFEYDLTEYIGDRAFYNCISLPDPDSIYSIEIPRSVKYIGRDAFARSESFDEDEHLDLTILSNPDIKIDCCYSHEPIDLSAFATKPTAQHFAEYGVISANEQYGGDRYVFTDYNAKELYADYILNRKDPYEDFIAKIPEGVTFICDNAFQHMPVDEVILPNSLQAIGEECFSDTNISEIVIPPNVESIDRFAFARNEFLEKVTINSDKIYKMDAWFDDCPSLESITVPPCIREITSYSFDNCINLKNIEISEGVEEIEWNAFDNCKSLKKLVLPTTIKTLENGWDSGLDTGKTGDVTEIIFKGHEDWKIPKGYHIKSYKDGKLDIGKCFSEGGNNPAKIKYFTTEEMLEEIEELYNRAVRYEEGYPDRKYDDEMNRYWHIAVFYKDIYVSSDPAGDHVGEYYHQFNLEGNTRKKLEYILSHREGILFSFIETYLPDVDMYCIYYDDEEFDCNQDNVAYNIEDAFFMRKYAPDLKELPMNLITRLRLCEERKR